MMAAFLWGSAALGAATVGERVDSLMALMTVEEKVGQLLCPLGWEMWEKNPEGIAPSAAFKELQHHCAAGMLWAAFRADPWTGKTLGTGLTPRQAAEAANALQSYARDSTRLGIPLFLAEEAPHGHMAIGTTTFPTGIALASTWDPSLLQRVGEAIAAEVRAQGAHISYGPVLDLVRDARWGRVEETFGECPRLSGRLGSAMVRGLSGGQHPTIATVKHFIAYGSPEAGQNGNYSAIGTRDLLQNFLPPFREAVDSGALSIMTSYNSIDGVPCTADSLLLRSLLRDQWGFEGFTVSDLYAIDGLVGSHHTAGDLPHAAVAALRGGCDVDLGARAYPGLVAAVSDGTLSESLLDRAVERVLRQKFEMGLFDNPFVNPDEAESTVHNPDHVALALQAARQSVTLLKNDHSMLPIQERGRAVVAVIGPNADAPYNQLGDYTAPQPAGKVVTVAEGLRRLLGADRVTTARGCGIRDTSSALIAQAVETARSADVVVAVVGGSSGRDFSTSYQDTGAAMADHSDISDMDAGEGCDRASLSLGGGQPQLLEALKATGKPMVVVYIQGRPLEMNWAAENADALLTAWYPGEQGGTAIAEVLTGRVNPSGHLPLTVPRSVGQLPLYYNRRAPRLHHYIDCPSSPLFPFGYGLSYSEFEYSDLSVLPSERGDGSYDVEMTIENTSDLPGVAVPQVYIRRLSASVVQPMLQLKAFHRVALAGGESRRVSLTLSREDFAIVGRDCLWSVEPGKVEILAGPDSGNLPLSAGLQVE